MKKTQLLAEAKITASQLLHFLHSLGIPEKENFTSDEVLAIRGAIRAKPEGKGFTPRAKGDRPTQSAPLKPQPTSTTIPTARQNALALSTQSHDAMNALQREGLQNAAAYVQRKTAERNAVVDKVSDAIAYLSDPDVLEADIFAAAAAKVQARSEAWAYPEDTTWDTLFALPESSQGLLGEA
jgi:hypothetical protein